MPEIKNPSWENLETKAEGMAKASDERFKDILRQTEGLARENTEEAREKLADLARQFNIEVKDNMSAGEIKNKVKAKIRNIT